MNKATRNRIEKKASATVKARRQSTPKVEGEAIKAEAKASAAKQVKPVKEGALPALPKIPATARPRKARPTQPCTCGCGTPTQSLWAPGHDARAKGWAIRIERDLIKMSDVPTNEQPGAKFYLKLRKEMGTTGGIKIVKSDKRKVQAPTPAAVAPAEEPAPAPAVNE